MPLNKMQIKAQVFKIIEPLRSLSALDLKTIDKVFFKIKAIKGADLDFIAKLLIKEADCEHVKVASTLLFLAQRLTPENFMDFVLSELNSPKVTDDKKMFLINLLSGLGINFEPEEIESYLLNPKEAINRETKRFMEIAKISPDAIVDFLDFYFSSLETEKEDVIDSVISEAEDDEIANLVSTVALAEDSDDMVLYCLEVVEKIKSPFLIKPLKYLSLHRNEKIAKIASKMLMKLTMQGFSSKKVKEHYDLLMEDFEKPIIKFSYPDGNSNFSIVVSRKTKNDTYYLYFIAINLDLGPFSCFGFAKITKHDHDNVLKRFFNGGRQVTVSNSQAKKIIKEFTIKRISMNKNIPYEYFAWEKILDDIQPSKNSVEDIFTSGLTEREITKTEAINACEDDIVKHWFFRVSNINLSFSKLMSKILDLKKEEIFNTDNIIEEFSSDKKIVAIIKKRLIYLAFCLKNSKNKELADIYYSLVFNRVYFKNFIKDVLKKSVYEFFLNLRHQEAKIPKYRHCEAEKVQNFIEYIEENWVNKAWN